MNTIKIHHLGIDFGSSKTAIVGISKSPDGNGENDRIFLFYEDKNDSAKCFKTCLACPIQDNQTNKLYFFQKAADIVWDEPGWLLIDTLKESFVEIADDAKTRFSKKHQYAEKFFGAISSTLASSQYTDPVITDISYRFDFNALESITYGYPKYYTPSTSEMYRKRFSKVLKDAFGSHLDICGVSEPELAACAYNYARRKDPEYIDAISSDDLILILDFGGHTVDILVSKFHKVGGKVQLHPYTSPGSDSYYVKLGKKLNRSICEEIDENYTPHKDIEKVKCNLLKRKYSPANHNMGESCLLKTCIEGRSRVQLCYQIDEIPETEKRSDTIYVGLYDDMGVDLKGEYRKAWQQIQAYLKNNRVPVESIKHVLFTGGGSNIADLREYILNEMLNGRRKSALQVWGMYGEDLFGETIIDSQDGLSLPLPINNSVAFGAALIGAGLQEVYRSEERNYDSNVLEHRAQIKLRDVVTVVRQEGEEELKRKVNAIVSSS